jgi:hypothetical protein
MNDLVPYSSNTLLAVKATSLLLKIYDNHQDRQAQLELQHIQAKISQMQVAGQVISDGVQELFSSCVRVIELSTKLKAFKVMAETDYKLQKEKLDFFSQSLKPMVHSIENMCKNGIVIDTSNLSKEDRDYAIRLREEFIIMQRAYLNIIEKLI